MDIEKFITSVLEENKAEDIKLINLKNKASFANLMVISSGRSKKHVCSVAQNLMDILKKEGITPLTSVGMESGEWVLIDANDVIINIFIPESRVKYNLEGLWENEIKVSKT